jgi:molybdopterin converting factor small subunit
MAEEATAQPGAAPAGGANVNKVTFGTYTSNIKAEGKTIKEVKAFIKNHYNVPEDAQAYVNYQKVDENYPLKAGDAVQFHRPAGDKGALTPVFTVEV